jgi:TetR/AcrR family transcriptional regulator, tetracycline repressor protein
MDLADAETLEAVTIRRLAQELGVTPMALYWHFADKDALLLAVSERLWDEVRERLGEGQPARKGEKGWAQLNEIICALVAVLRDRPGSATLAPLAVLACRSGLDVTERALEILAAQGLEGERAAAQAHFVLSMAVTLAATRPGGHIEDEKHEDLHRAKKAMLASLPPNRYPRVMALAEFFVDCPDDDSYFEQGTNFVLGGVKVAASTAPSRSRA